MNYFNSRNMVYGAGASAGVGAVMSVGMGLTTVTPQRKSCMINLCEETVDDGVSNIDQMVSRVTHHAFMNTGIIQDVFNVETGELEVGDKDAHSSLYMTIKEKGEVTRDIVGRTIQVQPTSSSLDVLEVVDRLLSNK